MQITRFAAAIISPVILFVQGPTSDAAELKLKVADPLTAVLKELSPQFERDTGHKLNATLGISLSSRLRQVRW